MALTPPKINVLISGAGVAGPCLAYWLSRTRLNTSITVLERSPVPRVTGQAIDIRGPAISIIKKMGLEPAIRARNTTEQGTRLLNTSGKIVAEFAQGVEFTAEYEILRADLCELFFDATERLENVKYIYGDYVTALEQDENKVDVTFAKGGKETYDLIVGADGSTSKIRSMILDEVALKDSYNFIGQYVAYFSIPSRPTDTRHWYWYNAPNNGSTPKGLGLMIRPHRNPSTVGVYMCITTPAHGHRDPRIEEAMDAGPEAQKRALHEYFANAGWEAKRILEGMDTCSDFYMSRAAYVKLPTWHNNRAVLLGDAAFATFGVGTTLAIESAYFLAGEISKVQSKNDIPTALAKYEEVFRKIQAKDEGVPALYPQLAFPQTSWGLKVRNSVLWMAGKTKVYKLLPNGDKEDDTIFKGLDYEWVGEEKEGFAVIS
jgi:2-polyprenyl-6-methoxyphenol hydroxylase-like FAD-dependent oxidoreductase